MSAAGGLSRQYVKLCDVRDFADPALLAAARDLIPERDPSRHVERKVWEMAMLALFLEELGHLREATEALAVGAGDERVLFWLANRIGRMVATDIYGEGTFAEGEALASMLDDPAAHAPFPYREDHLEVRWMDMRELDFPDESFDTVFTLSSIEHVGGPGEIARAAAEIGRVLRPGGHAVIVTDCLTRLHPLNAAPVDLAVRLGTLGRKRRLATHRRRAVLAETFTSRELQAHIVEPSGLRLMQPLDQRVSEESWENLTRLVPPDYRLEPATGEFFPHVMVQVDRSAFTSVFLALVKP